MSNKVEIPKMNDKIWFNHLLVLSLPYGRRKVVLS